MDTNLIDAFGAYQRGKGLSETTIKNRVSILRGLLAHAGSELISLDIHDLRLYLGRPAHNAANRVKLSSRRTERGAIIAFYAFLQEDAYREDNPAGRLAPIRADKGQPRPFTKAQVDAMLKSGAYRRTRAMILIGYYQGFRVSQIAAVHGSDIDLTSMTIRTVGKGNKERTLPLSPVIAELALTMPRTDWWFPARQGRRTHVSGASVTDLITRAKKRAGILDPTLTPHSLRHAFGTDLVELEVDIRVVQELMMHESLATTQIYTGVSERRKRAAIEALPSIPIPTRSGRRATERPDRAAVFMTTTDLAA